MLHRHTVLLLLVSVHITACDYSILLHRHTVLLLLVSVYCVAAFCCTDFVGGCVFAVSLIFTCSDTSVCAPLQNLCMLYSLLSLMRHFILYVISRFVTFHVESTMNASADEFSLKELRYVPFSFLFLLGSFTLCLWPTWEHVMSGICHIVHVIVQFFFIHCLDNWSIILFVMVHYE